MKVAFCLYGLCGGSSERNKSIASKSHTIEVMLDSYNSYKKNIFDFNKDTDFDIYFHTRKHKNVEKIIELYKPKKYLVDDWLNPSKDKKIIFDASRNDSILKVLKLIDKNYDLIFVCRFDLTFLKPIDLKKENIKENTVCIPIIHNWWYGGKLMEQKYFFNRPKDIKIKYMDKKEYINDWWWVSHGNTKEKMIEMCQEYEIKHVKTGIHACHSFPAAYWDKHFDVKFSELSFYDTPLTRTKFGVYV